MNQARPQDSREASDSARDLRWMLNRLVAEVPGVVSVAVVSADGLPLLATEPPRAPAPAAVNGPRAAVADLATVVSGLGSLTAGAASLMEGGDVRQTLVAMSSGNLLVMSISDGSLLGVYTAPGADMGMVTYHMALLVGRAGHLLTPRLRAQLRQSASLPPGPRPA